MRLVTGFVTVVGLVVAGMAGCGGESFDAADDDGGAGQGGSGKGGASTSGGAGTSSGESGKGALGGRAGASAGQSGRGGKGGSPTGGAGAPPGAAGNGGQGAVGAAGAGNAGAGGAGGEPGDVCRLPPDSGPCEAAFARWYFDAASGVCHDFVYGGCEGNENNFESLEACHAACAGHGDVDPTACDNASECVVTAARCCGGNDPPTLADVTAVNASELQEFGAPCQLVDCASTIGRIPAYFGATCSAGHCLAFDVRLSELTECSAQDECVLRLGLGCCEGCSGSAEDLVALRGDANLGPLVCGDDLVDCPACAPALDETLATECIGGRCEVVTVAP